MKTLTAILVVAAFLAGCDQRGSSPVADVSSGSTGSTGSHSTGSDSTPIDTTPSGDKVLLGADLQGPPYALTPGTERRLDFYLAADQSLRVRGSSDGAPAGGAGPTYGRQTNWEIVFSSPDSIRGRFATTTTEALMKDSLWNFVDSSDGTRAHVVLVRMQTLTGACEARIEADSNALISVRVFAWSGIDTKLVGWTPPPLTDDAVSQLLWAGNPAKKVGSPSFRVRVPRGSKD